MQAPVGNGQSATVIDPEESNDAVPQARGTGSEPPALGVDAVLSQVSSSSQLSTSAAQSADGPAGLAAAQAGRPEAGSLAGGEGAATMHHGGQPPATGGMAEAIMTAADVQVPEGKPGLQQFRACVQQMCKHRAAGAGCMISINSDGTLYWQTSHRCPAVRCDFSSSAGNHSCKCVQATSVVFLPWPPAECECSPWQERWQPKRRRHDAPAGRKWTGGILRGCTARSSRSGPG